MKEYFEILLESNLEDDRTANFALHLLQVATKKKWVNPQPSEGCPECAACLFMSLMNGLSDLEGISGTHGVGWVSDESDSALH